jgi:hypothetical protein
LLWLRPDRVTHMDVDMQKDGGARQFTAESVRRPPFLWPLRSQYDLQGVVNRALGTMERSGHLEQCRRPRTFRRSQRRSASHAISAPSRWRSRTRIDQRAFGRVEAESQIVPDPDHSPAEVEGVLGEDRTFAGDCSAGIRLPRGIAMSIRSGVTSVKPWRATAIMRHRVPPRTRWAISRRLWPAAEEALTRR